MEIYHIMIAFLYVQTDSTLTRLGETDCCKGAMYVNRHKAYGDITAGIKSWYKYCTAYMGDI